VKKLFIRLLTVALLPALVACGFHLRGSIDLPPEWKTLHLSTVSPNSELSRELRASFEANDIQWVDRAQAAYTLQVGAEVSKRRNLTIGQDAKAAEFELILSTTLRVIDREGNEIMALDTIATHKVMTSDPENITGKVEEARLLRREMRRSLVRQIMRQIRFLATNPNRSQTS
jgi:LPS-assembly lipoprotein